MSSKPILLYPVDKLKIEYCFTWKKKLLLSKGLIKEPEQIFDSGHMYTGAKTILMNYLKLNVIFEP